MATALKNLVEANDRRQEELNREEVRRLLKVLPVEHPQLKSLWEVEAERRNYFDDYENFYAAMDVVRKQNPWFENCDPLVTRVLNRLREAAVDTIPYDATTPNKDSYGRRHGRSI